jgi:16S rRNA (adenine1518-N6/adenine1519-N6)-dimethyltransferase
MSAEEGRQVPWLTLKERLKASGFHPSRRLGQNFLLDENLTSAIVRDAQVERGDFVLEIGPGLGFLTVPLLDAGAQVLAVEIDGRLLELLQETVGERSAFSSLHVDCLEGKHELSPAVESLLPEQGPWRLVSNLPYSVSAPVLAVLAGLANPPSSMSVLVQREVADRICADPGSSAWGPISAKLQASYRAERGRTVAPGMFWPRPKVDSAVAHLWRLPDAPERERWLRFSRLVSALFGRRRQALTRVWGDMVGDRDLGRKILEEVQIDGKTRAEGLDLEALWRLADRTEWGDSGKAPSNNPHNP